MISDRRTLSFISVASVKLNYETDRGVTRLIVKLIG